MFRKTGIQYAPVLVCLVLSVLSGSVVAAQQKPLMAQGEVIVKFKSGVTEARINRLAAARTLRRLRHFRNIRATHFKAPSVVDTLALVRWLRRLPEVEYAEPNYYRYLNVIPSDALFAQQYGLDNQGQTGGTVDADIDAPEAWDLATGSKDVVVAVIDSGIDLDHVDLVDNLFVNPGEIPANGVDDDGNGYIDDVNGWDFVSNDNDPSDSAPACSGHGIHTAGTVGAVGDNGIGVSGVAQTVSILPLRAFRQIFFFCSATDADLLEAINYAELMGVDISSNSYGGGPFSVAMYFAIAGARHLFVAAAGNESRNNDLVPAYPASYGLDNILSIASTDDDDQLSSFSNFGTQSVDLAAPGSNILSTLNNSSYGSLSGTSMATPHVAGAAAVLLSADPQLTPHELKNRLSRSIDPKGLPLITGGRLNLFNALSLPPSPVSISMVNTGPSSITPGDPIALDLSIVNQTNDTHSFSLTFRIWTPFGETPPTPASLITLPPGQAIVTPLTGNFPAGAPAGSYRFIGRIQQSGGDALEEDQIIYDVN